MRQPLPPPTRDPESPAAAPALRSIPRASVVHVLGQVLGSARRVDMLSHLQRLHARYGALVMQHMGAFRMVNVFGPDANRFVLLDPEGAFSAKRPWDAIMGRIFPNGLLLRDGSDHKHHRKLMRSAFKRPVLRQYLDRMNPMIASRIGRWGDDGGQMLAFGAYKELTLDMATAIFVGADLGPTTREMNRVFEDLVAASMSTVRLPIPGLEFQRGLAGRKKMSAWLGDLVGKRRAGDGEDMFTRLCHAQTEDGERLSDQEIVDHMIFLMMAAHDTTTSALTSLTYELARHPAWQERIREECLALGQEAIAWGDGERLPALGWAFRETLRRYPPLPVIPRVATRRVGFGGFEIPEGAMVVVAPIHAHQLSEWWEAPQRFDPERFAPGRAEHERHTHLWIPFGGGPHHCIGLRFAELQVTAVMHQLLCRYRVRVPEGYRMPVQQAPISKPRDGLPVTLERL